MRIMFLNVQSPPYERAAKLFEYLSSFEVDVYVLSELSSGEGSLKLMTNLQTVGFQVHWERPQKRSYSVAIAVKDIHHKAVSWPSSPDPCRFKTVRMRINSQEFALFGTYFPSLNRANMHKRRTYLESLEPFIRSALANKERCVIFGGDINDIPSWHIPKIFDYSMEGHVVTKMLDRLGFVDLAKIYLPRGTYTWFDHRGAGQLLDAMYINEEHKYLVKEYYVYDGVRTKGLSDHSALIVELSA